MSGGGGVLWCGDMVRVLWCGGEGAVCGVGTLVL